MTATGLGPGLCRRWARVYTRRLPAERATTRREELESDLWEQANDSVAANRSPLQFHLEVIARVLSGVPADLSWRREIQRSQPRPALGGPTIMNRLTSHAHNAVIALGSLGVAAVTMVLPLLGSEGTNLTGSEVIWLLAAFGLGGALLVGLVLRAKDTRPAIATVLLVVGAAAPSVTFFWLPPVYLLSLAIALAALASTPHRHNHNTATT